MPFLWVPAEGSESNDNVKTKAACAPCIRGHRASTCDHIQLPIIEVKRPGRPQASHVSLPLNRHGCRDGHARTWKITLPPEHDTEEFKTNLKDREFHPGEFEAVSPTPYPKPKSKKVTSRRKTIAGSSLSNEDLQNEEVETTINGGFGVFRTSKNGSSSSNPMAEAPLQSMQRKSCCSALPSGQLNGAIEDQQPLPEFDPTTITAIDAQGLIRPSSGSLDNRTPSSTYSPQAVILTPPEFTDADVWNNFMSVDGHAQNEQTSPGIAGQELNTLTKVPDSVKCICGSACNCLGCPIHPHNPATTAYVSDIEQFMETDPLYNADGWRAARQRVVQAFFTVYPTMVPPDIDLALQADWDRISELMRDVGFPSDGNSTYETRFHEDPRSLLAAVTTDISELASAPPTPYDENSILQDTGYGHLIPAEDSNLHGAAYEYIQQQESHVGSQSWTQQSPFEQSISDYTSSGEPSVSMYSYESSLGMDQQLSQQSSLDQTVMETQTAMASCCSPGIHQPLTAFDLPMHQSSTGF